jgi:hypothetical protein
MSDKLNQLPQPCSDFVLAKHYDRTLNPLHQLDLSYLIDKTEDQT